MQLQTGPQFVSVPHPVDAAPRECAEHHVLFAHRVSAVCQSGAHSRHADQGQRTRPTLARPDRWIVTCEQDGFAIESELHLLNWEPQTQASSFGWGFRDASGVALIHWDIRDGLVDAETAALALKSRPGTVIERERHLLTLMRYTELSPARGPCGCIPGIAS